ncbi:hypothetical protein HIM_11786 [Hirsutella minnesotensis 3608]|uniref:Uncharacterized protein n=1 Tax=Hirsutella minnesotensis 3608 TaxID=1043627 RepID=A0A0F7ZFB0_9HYPO|nr:hypothetical protein HIM_11786 [Hirsutella minnesotensis 3608]
MKRQQTQSPDQRRACPRRELPAWYYRLVVLTIKEDREVYPEDFDEDLSDLDEAHENSDRGSNTINVDYECDGEDSECECPLHPDAADTLSERSYNGSDADFYYELRDEREERKRELRDMKERERTERQCRRELESNREGEVQAAYEFLRQTEFRGCRLRLDPIAGKTFYLFSADHVDHCYNPEFPELYPTKYVEFYTVHEEHPRFKNTESSDNHAEIQGHLYLNADCGCDFAPFCPPTHTSEASYLLKSLDGDHELLFQFISNDYLIMTASRKLVCPENAQAAPALETLKFAGIRSDLERDRRRQEKEHRLRRSPSPRETWFEMNHPMDTIFVDGGGSEYDGPDSDVESYESTLRLQYNTVRGYVSAIQKLYDEQKSRGVNPAARPQGVALKALKRSILATTWDRKRKECVHGQGSRHSERRVCAGADTRSHQRRLVREEGDSLCLENPGGLSVWEPHAAAVRQPPADGVGRLLSPRSTQRGPQGPRLHHEGAGCGDELREDQPARLHGNMAPRCGIETLGPVSLVLSPSGSSGVGKCMTNSSAV